MDRHQVANDAFAFFSDIYCLNLDDRTDRWAEMTARFKRLGLARQVRRFPAIATPHNRHIGCAQSIRAIIAEASARKLDNCLILEDDAVFLDRASDILQRGLRDLANRPWDLFYLGAATPREATATAYPFAEESSTLKIPGRLTCTHAVAFNHTAYEQILASVPSGGPELDAWLEQYGAIDQFLAENIEHSTFRTYLLHPRIAIQPALESAGKFDPEIFDPALCEAELFHHYHP